MTDETIYVTLAELATKWRVSAPTARNRTRSEGFPPPLVVGPRSLRWPEEEVLEWEARNREQSATRRVATKSRPQYKAVAVRQPAKGRTIVREKAA